MFKKVLITLMLALGLVAPTEALTRKEFPGGMYAEARTDGFYAVLIPHVSVITPQTTVPLPPAELAAGGMGPLYIRIPEAGEFKFAGQSHAGLGTWEWRNNSWQLLAPACGVSPVIYDLIGQINISNCSGVGSQGWRYVESDGTLNGKLITGDATYSDPVNHIWEWTKKGNVTAGQGEAGCIAIRGTDRRMLEKGHCTFLRFNRSGDLLAIAMVKLQENKSVIIWLTESELNGFPLETPVVDPPIDPPPPAAEMPNRLSTLQGLRNGYPAQLNQQQAGELMAKLAYTLRGEGFGLYRKDGGNNCPIPNSSVKVSCDIILHKPTSTWCDVLRNGPDVGETGPSTPTWCKGDPGDMTNFFSPPDPGGVVNPPPPPPDNDLEKQLIAAKARIEELVKVMYNQVAQIQDLEARLAEAVDTALDAATERDQVASERDAAVKELNELKAKPEPACEAKLLGFKIPCKIIKR